jgi:hypothetical protein
MNKKQVISLLALLLVPFVMYCAKKKPLNPYHNRPTPEARIVSGPQSGDTLSQSQASFAWEGNNQDCQYSYKLTYTCAFDSTPWSDWTSSTNIFFQYLDEETYTFGVRGGYPEGDEQENPETVDFTVNAYREPSLLIKPCICTVYINQPFTIEVMAEAVEELMAAKINVNFSRDTLEIVQGGIEEGDFLKKNGGEVILFNSVMNSQGKVEIDLGIAEGTTQGVSGSGTLAVLTFKAMKTGVAFIYFELHDLRDISNQTIQIAASRSGKVSIQ